MRSFLLGKNSRRRAGKTKKNKFSQPYAREAKSVNSMQHNNYCTKLLLIQREVVSQKLAIQMELLIGKLSSRREREDGWMDRVSEWASERGKGAYNADKLLIFNKECLHLKGCLIFALNSAVSQGGQKLCTHYVCIYKKIKHDEHCCNLKVKGWVCYYTSAVGESANAIILHLVLLIMC